MIELLSLDPQAAGVKLERSFDPSIPDLRADADRLTQVFLNLGRNALQALAGEGTLRIETRMALEQRLTAPDGTSLPTVLVSVRDDGPGIEASVLRAAGHALLHHPLRRHGPGPGRQRPLGVPPRRRAAGGEPAR